MQDSRRLNAADVASITRLVGLLQHVPKVASVQVAGVSPDARAVQLRLRARISVSATPDKDKTLVDCADGAVLQGTVRRPGCTST